MFVVAILLDSSLLVAASLPQRQLTHAQSARTDAGGLALLYTQGGIWAFSDGRYLSANLTARGEIMAFILTNPGVYLREISEDLGISLGAVQYHIWTLTRAGQLEEFRSRRYRRFFGASRYPEAERIVLSLLRQGTDGRILTALSAGPHSHAELAESVGLTSQALTWHMKRLRSMGVVEAAPLKGLERCSYRLVDSVLPQVRAFAGNMQRPRRMISGRQQPAGSTERAIVF
jgi:DNA-binding transcriptional ArsR family regulator